MLSLHGRISRPPPNGNGQLDLCADVVLARVARAMQHRFVDTAVEVRIEAVVFLDREWVVLVRVALRTTKRGPQPSRRGRIDSVDQHGVANLVDFRTAGSVHRRIAVKARRN